MRFVFSGNLLRFNDYTREIDLEVEDLKSGLVEMVERWPAMKDILLDSDGNLRRLHRVFLNGTQMETAQVQSQARPSDEVTILTAIAGG